MSAVEMIQVDLAKTEMNKVPVGKIGGHYKVPCNLTLYAQVDVQRGRAWNVSRIQAAGLLGQLNGLNRQIRICQFLDYPGPNHRQTRQQVCAGKQCWVGIGEVEKPSNRNAGDARQAIGHRCSGIILTAGTGWAD